MVTTMMPVSRTNLVPSCWLELPLTRPPPWIHTYTGSRWWDRVLAGRWTLRNRQSSVSDSGPLVLGSAGQRLPYASADLTPFHGFTGLGGTQRSRPVGGWA